MRKKTGFTLLELTIVMTVLLVVLGAVMATLQTANESARANIARTEAIEQAKNALRKMSQEIEESGMGTVCALPSYSNTVTQTALPPSSGGPTPVSFSITATESSSQTKFLQNGVGQQCASSTCPWFYNAATGQLRYPQAQLTESRTISISGSTSTTLARYGRPWPASFQACPLDGSSLLSGSYQGAIRFLTPRDPSGDFVSDEYSAAEASSSLQKKTDWMSLVFYAPFFNSEQQRTELRRYVVYKTDLFASSALHASFSSSESSWTAWSGNQVRDATGTLVSDLPTFTDLLDFGGDGTVDGVPDNRIPNRPEDSDAHFEFYLTSTSVSGSTVEGQIQWIKYLWDDTAGTYRYMSLLIDRRTGQITWTVYFGTNSFTEYWYRSVVLTRTPATIVGGVGAVDFSTQVSNPFQTGSNEGGVESSNVVRIGFTLDRESIRRGGREVKEGVLVQQVSPRNF